MPIFLDAIDRLGICNIIDKPLHNWSSLFSSSMKDVFYYELGHRASQQAMRAMRKKNRKKSKKQ